MLVASVEATRLAKVSLTINVSNPPLPIPLSFKYDLEPDSYAFTTFFNLTIPEADWSGKLTVLPFTVKLSKFSGPPKAPMCSTKSSRTPEELIEVSDSKT